MNDRLQRTIQKSTSLRGIGLFTNTDVTVTIQPAEENHGIVFQRIDLADCPLIPADIDFLAPEHRRTKLVCGDASVEMVEHAMAALAGLQVDNCLIQIDAPELPGCDGSALPYAEALWEAEPVSQSARRERLVIVEEDHIDDGEVVISMSPYFSGYRLSYELDYGTDSVIPPQLAELQLTPEAFLNNIASARTFVLEEEIAFLKSKGYGQKVTKSDLLVYGSDGPIGSELRAHNECARHKLLDCLGDLALCGCDIQGHIRAFRSGHRHNHQLARKLKQLRQIQAGEAYFAA